MNSDESNQHRSFLNDGATPDAVAATTAATTTAAGRRAGRKMPAVLVSCVALIATGSIFRRC